VSGDLKAVFGPTKEEEEEKKKKKKEEKEEKKEKEEEEKEEKEKDVVAGGDEEVKWDQEEEVGEEEEEEEEEPTLQSTLLSADPGPESEEASGFKFSFFEDDVETGSGEAGRSQVGCSSPRPRWFLPHSNVFSSSRVQSREHPGAKGVMATRHAFPRQQLG